MSRNCGTSPRLSFSSLAFLAVTLPLTGIAQARINPVPPSFRPLFSQNFKDGGMPDSKGALVLTFL
jgi:hypothetical protein